MEREDNPKSRGRKHQSNKKKFSKHKPPAQGAPPPKPKSLDSNWDRYEQRQEENRVGSSTDFSVLVNAPITHGSHFQFKSDKNAALEISEPTQSLFSLDLGLLESSLSTIPFSVRSGITDDNFTENQRKVMNALDDNVNGYLVYLKSCRQKDTDVIFGSEGEETSADDSSDPDEETPDTARAERLSVHEEGKKDDLECWLDDILDD